ncbi:MAG: hypothetical protein GY679_01940 [Mycoplasma sp.]|nr:hypothetical protein [Mycoplasma sp.]
MNDFNKDLGALLRTYSKIDKKLLEKWHKYKKLYDECFEWLESANLPIDPRQAGRYHETYKENTKKIEIYRGILRDIKEIILIGKREQKWKQKTW